MKEIVVVSGKGGTGKTSITAAFAALSENWLFCDADVDAANMHLILNPAVKETHAFSGGNEAIIQPDKCSDCGICLSLCRFDAILFNEAKKTYTVQNISCEGCGVCYYFCPEKAISFPEKKCGDWFVSDTDYGPMIHARLGIAEENSGKLVSLVRREARERAIKQKKDMLLTDGPPGVGCPVIASVSGATALLVVTEPTVSGIHDMQRVVELANHFKVPVMICVNKYDLNLSQTEAIRSWCMENKLPYVGEIPFDKLFNDAMAVRKSIIAHAPDSDVSKSIRTLYRTVITSDALEKKKEVVIPVLSQ